jgi:hypothetical protein
MANLAIDFVGGVTTFRPLTLKMLIGTDNKGVITSCGQANPNSQVLGYYVLWTDGTQSTYNNMWCAYGIKFAPGWNKDKILVTGAVSYYDWGASGDAKTHTYNLFGVNMNAGAGTVDLCFDAFQDLKNMGSEKFTWWILGVN